MYCLVYMCPWRTPAHVPTPTPARSRWARNAQGCCLGQGGRHPGNLTCTPGRAGPAKVPPTNLCWWPRSPRGPGLLHRLDRATDLGWPAPASGPSHARTVYCAVTACVPLCLAHSCVGQATPGVVCVRVLCGVQGPCGLMPAARGQPRLRCPHVCQHMHPQVMCLLALVAVCGRGQPSVRSVFCCGRTCHWTAAPHAPTGYPPWFGGARSLHAPTRDTRLRSHGHVRAHVCRAASRSTSVHVHCAHAMRHRSDTCAMRDTDRGSGQKLEA